MPPGTWVIAVKGSASLPYADRSSLDCNLDDPASGHLDVSGALAIEADFQANPLFLLARVTYATTTTVELRCWGFQASLAKVRLIAFAG